MSASYTIAMLRPPPCQSLGKVQCKYINPYICEYIAFKIQRKALSCLELHFTPFIFCALTESPIPSILLPITVHQKQDGWLPVFRNPVQTIFKPVLKTSNNVFFKRLKIIIQIRYSTVVCKLFLDNSLQTWWITGVKRFLKNNSKTIFKEFNKRVVSRLCNFFQ